MNNNLPRYETENFQVKHEEDFSKEQQDCARHKLKTHNAIEKVRL